MSYRLVGSMDGCAEGLWCQVQVRWANHGVWALLFMPLAAMAWRKSQVDPCSLLPSTTYGISFSVHCGMHVNTTDRWIVCVEPQSPVSIEDLERKLLLMEDGPPFHSQLHRAPTLVKWSAQQARLFRDMWDVEVDVMVQPDAGP